MDRKRVKGILKGTFAVGAAFGGANVFADADVVYAADDQWESTAVTESQAEVQEQATTTQSQSVTESIRDDQDEVYTAAESDGGSQAVEAWTDNTDLNAVDSGTATASGSQESETVPETTESTSEIANGSDLSVDNLGSEVENETEAASESETIESVTEAASESEAIESVTEATSESETIESVTEAASESEAVESVTEAASESEAVESVTESSSELSSEEAESVTEMRSESQLPASMNKPSRAPQRAPMSPEEESSSASTSASNEALSTSEAVSERLSEYILASEAFKGDAHREDLTEKIKTAKEALVKPDDSNYWEAMKAYANLLIQYHLYDKDYALEIKTSSWVEPKDLLGNNQTEKKTSLTHCGMK